MVVESPIPELARVPSALERARGADLARAQAVAKWTDRRFLDPLLGLVLPGLGDVLGVAAGLYIVAIAVRHGVPRKTVRRMLINLGIDCLGGVIPIVGDLFDFLNRANVRNARLLERHLGETPGLAEASAVDPSGHGDLIDG
jgi:hypothetical protein